MPPLPKLPQLPKLPKLPKFSRLSQFPKFPNLLIPNGKISNSYKSYLFWNSLGNFFASIEVSISSDTMLNFLSNTDSTNLSINYVGKDILGQLGSLYILNKVGKKIDEDLRKATKNNIIIQQIAVTLENITAFLSIDYFLPIATISNLLKGVSFMAFGATSAKIINKLSIDKENIGEIYSKITIANTLSTSLGMGFGLIIAKQIPCVFTRLSIVTCIGFFRYYCFLKSIEKLEEKMKEK